jgi:selenocysteine-specific elongation factor
MIIGTAGHIDHGKTSLVRALTGVDTDRLKEEKARGISIDLGFAYIASPQGGILGFVDVPGHEKFIHNMLAGATGIDFALLVIAADDGVMPQTREHLAIIDLLGISHGIVALNKADLATAERIDDLTDEIDALLRGTSLAGIPIAPLSALSGEGVDDLRKYLFDAAARVPRRSDEKPFRLAVDRSFTLRGAGTLVTGTVMSGVIGVGDQVAISPSGLTARVRSIHAQNQATTRGVAGDRCALNLTGNGISKDDIARGDVVLDQTLHAPTDRIDGRMRLLPSEARPLAQWTPVRVHHAASDVAGRIVLLGDRPIQPGEEALVQIVLDRPIAAAAGDCFVLRDTTAQRTIGGGRFIDLRPPKRKRRTPERIAQINAMAIADPEKSLSFLLGCAPHYIDLDSFARDRALEKSEMATIGTRLGIVIVADTDHTYALAPDTWDSLKTDLLATLAAFHKTNPDFVGINLEKLRLQSRPRLPAPAFRAMLHTLRSDDVALDGDRVHLRSHSVRLADADEKLWALVFPLISGAERFRPPRVRDLSKMLCVREASIRQLMKTLGRIGRLHEVTQDRFFLRSTMAEIGGILEIIAAESADGQFTAAQLRDKLGNGRKVAIAILEFLDGRGVTVRRGDLRRIDKAKLANFCLAGKDAASSPGREASPVGRPDFKSGKDRKAALGGFDSLSLPPGRRSEVS